MITKKQLEDYHDNLVKLNDDCLRVVGEANSSLEENAPVDYDTHNEIYLGLKLSKRLSPLIRELFICQLMFGSKGGVTVPPERNEQAIEMYNELKTATDKFLVNARVTFKR